MPVYLVHHEQETEALANKIARHCPKNKRIIIFLAGELGSGKTTFARFFLNVLGHHGLVKSPTYTLIEPYAVGQYLLYHLDLYRLSLPAEILEIGLHDELDRAAIWLIEWPERAINYLPKPDIHCIFTILAAGRQIQLEAQTEIGSHILSSATENLINTLVCK
jgi:tRNA threonylcarbamoyladenosine biosynthesis protein TsaE